MTHQGHKGVSVLAGADLGLAAGPAHQCCVYSALPPGGAPLPTSFPHSLSTSHPHPPLSCPTPVIPLKTCTFIFLAALEVCGILVPQPGTEPRPSAVEVLSPNLWAKGEFPNIYLLSLLLVHPLSSGSAHASPHISEEDHFPTFLSRFECLQPGGTATHTLPTSEHDPPAHDTHTQHMPVLLSHGCSHTQRNTHVCTHRCSRPHPTPRLQGSETLPQGSERL